jgi:CHAD domain-containing protein
VAARELRRLRKAVAALPNDPSDDELHAIRIRGKRARYAAELAADAGTKRAAAVVERAKTLQDVIGSHQDAVVAEEKLRELLDGHGGRTALAAGRVIERQRERKREARREFPKVWRRLEQASRRLP